jgi:hypothetical protein
MLRRFVLPLLAAVLLSLLALGGGASSAQSSSQGAENLAAGTGTIAPPCCGEPMLHVNAQSGALGVNPRGHFWIRYPNGGGEFGGTVVCLSVVGNVAGLTGHIERVKVPRATFGMGNYLQIWITDMGSPGTADLVNFDQGTSSNPNSCSGRVGDLAISQGNYVVHDKPVLDLSALNLLIAQFEAAAKDPYG